MIKVDEIFLFSVFFQEVISYHLNKGVSDSIFNLERSSK